MNKVIIKNITIKNFQGIREQYIDFDEKATTLRGFNGCGKTTVLSAILWCLTSNDYYNRSKFSIYPTIDGVEYTNLFPEVTLELEQNGEVFKIYRNYKGRKNTIKVNDIPFGTNKEYETYFEKKFEIDIEKFKLLSNPNFVTNISWQELRDLVMQFVKTTTDEDIASLPEFKPIADKVKEYGIDTFANSVKEQTRELKNTQKPQLEGKIMQQSETFKNLSQIAADTTNLQERKVKLETQVAKYQTFLAEEVEKQNRYVAEQDKLSQMTLNLNQNLGRLENLKNSGMQLKTQIDYRTNYEEMRKRDLEKLESDLSLLENSLKQQNSNKSYLVGTNEKINNEICDLKAKLNDLSDVCPYCHQVLPKEQIAHIQAENKVKFNEETKDKLNLIEVNEKQIKELDVSIKKIEKSITNCKKEIEKTKVKDYSKCKKDDELKELFDNRKNVAEEYKKQQVVCKLLTKDVEKQKEIVAKLPKKQDIASPVEIMEELRIINDKLNQANAYDNEKQKLEDLKQEYDVVCKKYNKYSLLNDMCVAFKKTKADMIAKEFKKYFKITEITTTETLKNGDEKECFKLSLDGKPYEMLSSGEKIRVGLDLTLGLQKLLKVEMPLLIDQLGEISKLDSDIKQQIIGTMTMKELPREEFESEKQYTQYYDAYKVLNARKGL